MKKIQLGCGSNFLEGWENYDMEVDIRKTLPFQDNSVDIIFSEHTIEHIEYEEFKSFLNECFRCLKDEGILRLTTPSLDKIIKIKDQEYIEWCNKRYSLKESTYCNMVNLMFRGHQHKYLYDKETISILLSISGFKKIRFQDPGFSENEELKSLENHWKKISKKFNDLESMCVEAVKSGKY